MEELTTTQRPSQPPPPPPTIPAQLHDLHKDHLTPTPEKSPVEDNISICCNNCYLIDCNHTITEYCTPLHHTTLRMFVCLLFCLFVCFYLPHPTPALDKNAWVCAYHVLNTQVIYCPLQSGMHFVIL